MNTKKKYRKEEKWKEKWKKILNYVF